MENREKQLQELKKEYQDIHMSEEQLLQMKLKISQAKQENSQQGSNAAHSLFPDPSFSGKCTGYGCLGQLQLLRSFRQTDLFLHGFSSQNINFLFNCCPLM